jgi:hypothetical protein
MGIGVWYEMVISDPMAFLFKNADPQGSLAANVSNATIRSLSNLPLSEMLETRHEMSQAVRAEVSPKSIEWGYRLGSVYIRKVHFRDRDMIKQIEEKVVNRLRQVTSAIRQDGANQVSVITSTAEREAANAAKDRRRGPEDHQRRSGGRKGCLRRAGNREPSRRQGEGYAPSGTRRLACADDGCRRTAAVAGRSGWIFRASACDSFPRLIVLRPHYAVWS